MPACRLAVWVLLLGLIGPGTQGWSFAQGTATETVSFLLSVEPVFTVNSSSDQGGNVELGDILPNEPAVSRTMRVSVRSNAGRPYQITMRLEQDLFKQPGSGLSEEPVQFTVSGGTQGGRSEVTSPTALSTQPMVVFTSSSGASEDFQILFTASTRHLLPSGNYRAHLDIRGELR